MDEEDDEDNDEGEDEDEDDTDDASWSHLGVFFGPLGVLLELSRCPLGALLRLFGGWYWGILGSFRNS